jgi:hypothetical protein
MEAVMREVSDVRKKLVRENYSRRVLTIWRPAVRRFGSPHIEMPVTYAKGLADLLFSPLARTFSGEAFPFGGNESLKKGTESRREGTASLTLGDGSLKRGNASRKGGTAFLKKGRACPKEGDAPSKEELNP